MKCVDIMNHMEVLAPQRLTQSWDNTGLLIGDPYKEINTILAALDADVEVIEEAIKLKADMIITHHPIIFKPINKIRKDTPDGDNIAKLIKNDICVFSAHTNLDMADGGVNDELASRLGLKEVKTLLKNHPYEEVAYDIYDLDNQGRQYGFAKIGNLSETLSFNDFARMVKDNLSANFVRVGGDIDQRINKVVVSSGSYSGIAQAAKANKADVIVTGDLKYHDAQEIIKYGMSAIDAGHFATENIIIDVIRKHILKLDENINIVKSNESKDIFNIIL